MSSHVATVRRQATTASPSLRHAAALARDAAESIADDLVGTRECGRHLDLAERLSAMLDLAALTHNQLVLASPRVIERSGRARSLVEMIEAEAGNDAYRIRLAKLLLRALEWVPNSLPEPRA